MFLADTQWHWSMEGRDLVREGNFGEYQENPGFAKEVGLEAESPRPVLDPTVGDMTPGRARDARSRAATRSTSPRSSTACTSGG